MKSAPSVRLPRTCVSVRPDTSLVRLPDATCARVYAVPMSSVNDELIGIETYTGIASSDTVSSLGKPMWYCMNCGANRSSLSNTDWARAGDASATAIALATVTLRSAERPRGGDCGMDFMALGGEW